MKFLTLIVSLCAGAACAQDTDGWITLFNGQDMTGWEMHWGKDWKAEKGSLACDGSERSWLSTTQSFSNYVLKLEFRGSEKVNSGVFLRSEKEGQPHITGYELQIWDYQPAAYNTGSLVGSLKAQPVKIIPDQWNQYEITADGDHFVVVLNGKTVLDGHDSKHASGVIGFQCQPDNPIAFRNIKIRPIRNTQ
jgi:Domain of Unknown Function (DUF1080)